MTRLCTMILCSLAMTLTVVAAAGAMTTTPADKSIPRIELAVSFDQDLGLLRGTAKLTLPAGNELTLLLGDLRITAALLSYPNRENLPLTIGSAGLLPLPAAAHEQRVLLSYEKQVGDTFANSITEEAIVLTSAWHPVPDRPVIFSLTARLPPPFLAISESDWLPDPDRDGWTAFSFSQPVRSLHLAAAPYSKQGRTVRDGLSVYTFFLPGQQDLAADYLEAAADYLNRYERTIGPYPYAHYVIAENSKPTGLGLPTFTLLGSQVIRLPFIRQTSLGHEILHSWFGNSIEVAPGSGNWAEGLTTYLADLAYRSEAGEGPAARQEALLSYLSYVTPATPPLRSFIGSGHDRLDNRDRRAVGYSRAALLFHELAGRLGAAAFSRVIRRFSTDFRGRAASWVDLEELFSAEAGQSLERFFQERLDHNELPTLAVEDVRTISRADRTVLSFTIVQQQEQPYELLLPITVTSVGAPITRLRLISEQRTPIELDLDAQPLELIIDQDYDLARTLSGPERRPVWSQIMGSDHVLVVLADTGERQRYEPFLRLAKHRSWPVADPGDLDTDALADQDLIFLGTSGPASRSLFGTPQLPSDGFALEMRFHPLRPERVVALVSSDSAEQTAAVVNRLSHYGRASSLHFRQGTLVEQSLAPSEQGIRIRLLERPTGLARTDLSDFDRLVDRLSDNRVVYIGETHTSRADHLLQLLLIEALHRRDANLAIGMEMFPASSQTALDRYITDPDFSEADFLRESKYFEVWGYDYRLFRPIFALARKQQIPVIGLNVERQLVSATYNSGGIDKLTDEQRRTLPVDRALDLPGYRERLMAVHAQHAGSGDGARTPESFIEAQVLWDEGMAAAIHHYLVDHPEKKLVVLAGSQHTRIDSGIPPRLARRLTVTQATIGNLASQSVAELGDTVDYLFFLDSDELPERGRIGVTLQESKDFSGGLQIAGLEPGAHAAAAGLQVGDRLVAIDKQVVTDLTDVRIALLERRPGELLPITIRRSGAGEQQEIDLKVELSGPPAAHLPGMMPDR
jgi:aminopeptidase N